MCLGQSVSACRSKSYVALPVYVVLLLQTPLGSFAGKVLNDLYAHYFWLANAPK